MWGLLTAYVKKWWERNWSQEQLDRLIGVSLRTIQRVEAGNKASLETLKSLTSVFEIELSKLTEIITILDKNCIEWKAEPWFIKFFLFGSTKRTHMVISEYTLLAIGIIAWLVFETIEVTTPIAFLFFYLNSKLVSYINEKSYW
jgi:transcriptional regulator with XRE-family HTH domain